ncbi:MAG: hypothetical protein JWM95_4839 [Gemmatimonadetes bacterium]|nr:hypothetical protein [Gemmatimonadota bacterium]
MSSTSPRREFLHRLVEIGTAAGGIALASGCAPSVQAASVAGTAPLPAQSKWDMSWTSRLARYKTAYDAPEILNGAALAYAAAAMAGYHEIGVAASDFTPVLILRHAASIMVLNDATWAKLELGDASKLKDPTTGAVAKRNPFISYAKGDKFTLVGPGGGLDELMSHGAVVLTCDSALRGYAYQLRMKEPSLTVDQSIVAIRAAIIPGVYLMPNGIFAVSAAQDAGCQYMRVMA